MDMKDVFNLVVTEIDSRGMILRPKDRIYDDSKESIVILCCFFGFEGVAAISISDLEIKEWFNSELVEALVRRRVDGAFKALRANLPKAEQAA